MEAMAIPVWSHSHNRARDQVEGFGEKAVSEHTGLPDVEPLRRPSTSIQTPVEHTRSMPPSEMDFGKHEVKPERTG